MSKNTIFIRTFMFECFFSFFIYPMEFHMSPYFSAFRCTLDKISMASFIIRKQLVKMDEFQIRVCYLSHNSFFIALDYTSKGKQNIRN